MSQWLILFGSLLLLGSCNDTTYPEIPLSEAIAKIQSGKIDRVAAISESTLIITERSTAKIFQSSINGQFDRIESIASQAHFDGTIGSYEFQPKPSRFFTPSIFLVLGGLLIGVLLLFRVIKINKQ